MVWMIALAVANAIVFGYWLGGLPVVGYVVQATLVGVAVWLCMEVWPEVLDSLRDSYTSVRQHRERDRWFRQWEQNRKKF